MATKTISIDEEAYERLRRARLRPAQSSSKVIECGRWDEPPSTGASLLTALEPAPELTDEQAQTLEQAQAEDARPEDPRTE